MRPQLLLLAATAVLLPPLAAQVSRYELGLRLRTFERHLDATPVPARRAAAFRELERAVQAFFRFDTEAVAGAIAAAEDALAGQPATPAAAFATTLQLQLAARVHDPASGPVRFQLTRAYQRDGEPTLPLALTVELDGATPVQASFVVDQLPFTGELDAARATPGDRTLTYHLRQGDELLRRQQQGLSLVPDLGKRLTAVVATAGARDAEPASLEAGTLDLLASLLQGMGRERPEETILPGARLLGEGEALVAALAAKRPFYGSQSTGQHWLRVPLGKSSAVVRLLAPAADAPSPLVIALHGAGGSENLFFDGYGDGAIVRECTRRGWFLVAPRLGFAGGPDLPALVEALAARWPIDRKRVLVLGHSMGAAQAMAAVGRTPERFAAVAALGGGGNAPQAAAARRLPFFVATGERDFARAGARRLHEALTAATIPSTFREYPAVEHLAIVQVALPDVFAFFDQALSPK